MTGVCPIKVVVRVRPLSQRELAENARQCVCVYEQHNQISQDEKMYAFDKVFDTCTSQRTIYDDCGAPLIEKLLDGYNCTIIAYGQTGSGKTYTMGIEDTSNAAEFGIAPRIIGEIFERIGNSGQHSVAASMLEIHEEKIYDLICTGNRDALKIRESKKGVVYVQGLSVHAVTGLEDAMKILKKGCRSRTKGGTAMNDASSRSHAIFTLTIEKRGEETSSKLQLVDLAGSERLKKTQAEGERMREGININEGLYVLGAVISVLADKPKEYVPYRDSKITRVLQDSLGGNSYAVMIVCVSPADTNASETAQALRFASRVKQVENKPIVNVDPKLAYIRSLEEELARRRAGDTICAECASSEKKKHELVEECNQLRKSLFEALSNCSKLSGQLVATHQMKEQLQELIRTAKEQLANNQIEELANILSAGPVLDAIEDDKEKHHSDIAEDNSEDETGDQGSAYVLSENAEKQISLSTEIANITEQINQKEMAFKMSVPSQDELEKLRAQYLAELEQLQARLAALEKEKQELEAKLRGTNIHHKLSEDRRRRLQELEKELQANKRRMAEIVKLERENVRLQEQSKQLSAELSRLKKNRVQMSRQLKDEEMKFRKLKMESDRKMAQMKNQEQKRAMELIRQQRAKDNQLAWLRRKYEEASACVKRLQEKQQAKCGIRRNARGEEQLLAVLRDELDVAYAANEAKAYCNMLNEERKKFIAQQQKLERKLARLTAEPPCKRRTGSDRSGISNEAMKEELEERIGHLQKEIELRSSELKEMERKCEEAHSKERIEKRWREMRCSQVDRAVVDFLFSEAVKNDMSLEDYKRTNENLKEQSMATVNDLQNKVNNLQKKLIQSQMGRTEQKSAAKPGENATQLRNEADNGGGAQHASSSVSHENDRMGRWLNGYDIREYRRPVQRFGDVVDLGTSSGDESAKIMDSDSSYQPTPQTRKRSSRISAAARARRRSSAFVKVPCSNELKPVNGDPEANYDKGHDLNATFTVEKEKVRLKPLPENEQYDGAWDHRTIVTRQIFDRN